MTAPSLWVSQIVATDTRIFGVFQKSIDCLHECGLWLLFTLVSIDVQRLSSIGKDLIDREEKKEFIIVVVVVAVAT